MKMYVWDDVLRDYSTGLVVAVGKDLKEALEVVLRDCGKRAHNECQYSTPEILELPSAAYCYGGA